MSPSDPHGLLPLSFPSSYAYLASLDQLVLDSVFSDHNSGSLGSQSYESRTSHIEMVLSGDECSNLPSHPAVDLDQQKDAAGGLVLCESEGVVGSDGDVGAVDEGRPDVDVLVALVGWRD